MGRKKIGGQSTEHENIHALPFPFNPSDINSRNDVKAKKALKPGKKAGVDRKTNKTGLILTRGSLVY